MLFALNKLAPRRGNVFYSLTEREMEGWGGEEEKPLQCFQLRLVKNRKGGSCKTLMKASMHALNSDLSIYDAWFNFFDYLNKYLYEKCSVRFYMCPLYFDAPKRSNIIIVIKNYL